jgi:hypothetical protein
MVKRYSSWTLPFLVAGITLVLAAPASAQCTDADSDGYYVEAGCPGQKDCNDAAPGTHPGAIEICDGYDNDCDGSLDNDAACARTCPLPGVAGGAVRVTEGSPVVGSSLSGVWTGLGYGLAWAANDELRFARADGSGSMVGDCP